MTEKLAKKYAHNEIELNKYNEWIEKGYFTAGIHQKRHIL